MKYLGLFLFELSHLIIVIYMIYTLLPYLEFNCHR